MQELDSLFPGQGSAETQAEDELEDTSLIDDEYLDEYFETTDAEEELKELSGIKGGAGSVAVTDNAPVELDPGVYGIPDRWLPTSTPEQAIHAAAGDLVKLGTMLAAYTINSTGPYVDNAATRRFVELSSGLRTLNKLLREVRENQNMPRRGRPPKVVNVVVTKDVPRRKRRRP